MSSVIAQGAECNTRWITNKTAEQFVATNVCRGLKKYKGIPDSYCALGLIVFKTEWLSESSKSAFEPHCIYKFCWKHKKTSKQDFEDNRHINLKKIYTHFSFLSVSDIIILFYLPGFQCGQLVLLRFPATVNFATQSHCLNASHFQWSLEAQLK